MAVKPIINPQDYVGESTDTKPTANVSAGSTFYETDTKALYIYNGTAWVSM